MTRTTYFIQFYYKGELVFETEASGVTTEDAIALAERKMGFKRTKKRPRWLSGKEYSVNIREKEE